MDSFANYQTPLGFLRAIHTVQLALCLWGGWQSYSAIKKLLTYETTSKKLAEWSKDAEYQLYKTRTTHATGVLIVIASTIVAIGMALYGQDLPAWIRFTANPVMLLGTLFGRGHIANYWAPEDGKTVKKISLPNMGDYNKAQKSTQAFLLTLQYLEYSWLASSFVSGVLGYTDVKRIYN